MQIYIRPFPEPGGARQVTTAGGSQPRWSPDGKELFYVGLDGRLMVVPIPVGADRQLEEGAAVALFRTRLATGAGINSTNSGSRAQCRGGDRDTHHGRPQLGRGVEEVMMKNRALTFERHTDHLDVPGMDANGVRSRTDGTGRPDADLTSRRDVRGAATGRHDLPLSRP